MSLSFNVSYLSSTYQGEQYYLGCSYNFVTNSVYFACRGNSIMKYNLSNSSISYISSSNYCGYRQSGGIVFSGHNYFMYLIPSLSNNIQYIDLNDRVHVLLDVGGGYKWFGGVYYNGFVYQQPCDSTSILEIDTRNNTVKLYSYPTPHIGHAFADVTVGPNGKLYFAPYAHNRILEFDPITKTSRYVGPTLQGYYQYLYGGICTIGDSIYLIPGSTNQIFKYNVYDGTGQTITLNKFGFLYWMGAIYLSQYGIIVGSPFYTNEIMIFNVQNSTTNYIVAQGGMYGKLCSDQTQQRVFMSGCTNQNSIMLTVLTSPSYVAKKSFFISTMNLSFLRRKNCKTSINVLTEQLRSVRNYLISLNICNNVRKLCQSSLNLSSEKVIPYTQMLDSSNNVKVNLGSYFETSKRINISINTELNTIHKNIMNFVTEISQISYQLRFSNKIVIELNVVNKHNMMVPFVFDTMFFKKCTVDLNVETFISRLNRYTTLLNISTLKKNYLTSSFLTQIWKNHLYTFVIQSIYFNKLRIGTELVVNKEDFKKYIIKLSRKVSITIEVPEFIEQFVKEQKMLLDFTKGLSSLIPYQYFISIKKQ